MKLRKTRLSAVLTSLILLSASAAISAQEPKYKADVPTSVTTPDKVHTELLGDLEFFDGMPDKATVKKAYDFLDFSRGTEAFLNGIPAASVYALLEGFKEAGSSRVTWASSRPDGRPLALPDPQLDHRVRDDRD